MNRVNNYIYYAGQVCSARKWTSLLGKKMGVANFFVFTKMGGANFLSKLCVFTKMCEE